MESIIINPKNAEELNFINELLNKLGIQNKTVSSEILEDAGLSLLMREVDRSDSVSEEEIRNKLMA
ncbi:MAG: hypothetical protein JJ895_09615 [Balneolaceae bacterium]|nr:hypothetical protein [Balneolaceae bacterium]